MTRYISLYRWKKNICRRNYKSAIILPVWMKKYSQYGVYTQEMCDMMEQIAEKYDLKLHSAPTLADEEELNHYVGGSFLEDGLSMGEAYIYENGTFQFDTDALIDGHMVYLQFRRSVKGTMDELEQIAKWRHIPVSIQPGEGYL